MRRLEQALWIPNDDVWQRILVACATEPLRNRLMVALAYDGALRREELVQLDVGDFEHAHRLIHLRAETTKSQRAREVAFGVTSSQLFVAYLNERRGMFGRIDGPLFRSASNRNYGKPLGPSTWSKTVEGIAHRAGVARLSTHTFRHLRLTDLARADWTIDQIALYAGHRDLATTMRYIHLSAGSSLPGCTARPHRSSRTGRTCWQHWRQSGERDRTASTCIACTVLCQNCSSEPSSETGRTGGPQPPGRAGSSGDPRAKPLALARLIDPLEAVSARWGNALTDSARNMLLMEVGRRSRAYWAWDEQIWTVFVASVTGEIRHRRRAHLVAWGYLFGGHRRLHHRVGMPKLRPLADFVFGHGAVDPALEQVCTLLERWETSPKSQPELVRSSVLDALLSAGSPHLKDVTLELLQDLVADHPASSARRRGLFKMSRVLAANGFIPEPLTGSHQQRGTRPETVASVPLEWLEMVRWRKFSTNEPGTIRTKFPLLLVAGRWAAERHPEATSPQAWTRDIAAEYIADAVIAVRGQWAGHNRNRTGWGEPLSASGKAGRVDTIRSFFCDLIEWEWITPRFDPRRVLALPLSVRAGRDPDPRIIDDAA
ncbi:MULTISPECIES: site-specific integrase [unclassified Streptomyces]|uniref:tyrosine-type recombinase/integrase n=1 Tax=unclassified Streptomyces TaxID=2593676 RepID=UPI001968270A|nr:MULTISPECIES: site-specific integrase [unclassified Streptomyces]